MTPKDTPLILHATCVAAHGHALLITGPSGSGKSALALRLMALGAQLVSDDQTALTPSPAGLIARCPSPRIRGLIEARGLGLLRADPLDAAPVALVVDLSRTEDHRLPPQRSITMAGVVLPLALLVPNDHFPAALMLYLQHGRQD